MTDPKKSAKPAKSAAKPKKVQAKTPPANDRRQASHVPSADDHREARDRQDRELAVFREVSEQLLSSMREAVLLAVNFETKRIELREARYGREADFREAALKAVLEARR